MKKINNNRLKYLIENRGKYYKNKSIFYKNKIN